MASLFVYLSIWNNAFTKQRKWQKNKDEKLSICWKLQRDHFYAVIQSRQQQYRDKVTSTLKKFNQINVAE
jgi:hypothetical protein